jgi:hypothetical protein
MISIRMCQALLCFRLNGALQRGAAIDLRAVAVGGSEEAQEWATGALEAASMRAGATGGVGVRGLPPSTKAKMSAAKKRKMDKKRKKGKKR